MSGLVHSHFKVSLWYSTAVVLSPLGVLASTCTCEGRLKFLTFSTINSLTSIIKHLRCKHVGALLLGVLVIKDHSNSTSPPQHFKRSNMNRFKNASGAVQ